MSDKPKGEACEAACHAAFKSNIAPQYQDNSTYQYFRAGWAAATQHERERAAGKAEHYACNMNGCRDRVAEEIRKGEG